MSNEHVPLYILELYQDLRAKRETSESRPGLGFVTDALDVTLSSLESQYDIDVDSLPTIERLSRRITELERALQSIINITHEDQPPSMKLQRIQDIVRLAIYFEDEE